MPAPFPIDLVFKMRWVFGFALCSMAFCSRAQAQESSLARRSWLVRNGPWSQGSAQPSLQSVPGIAHVPVANSLASSESWLMWSNHSERPVRGAVHAHNFHLALGLGQGLTVAGRISGYNYDLNSSSDLSMHFHWKIPWIPRHWFDLALGVQDVGGQISMYSNYYAVASREFGRFALTLGYGRGVESTQRAGGLLGGAVWQPLSFLSLGGEWDGRQLNSSARLFTPPKWFGGTIGFGSQAVLVDLLKQRSLYISAYLQLSLASSPGLRRQGSQPLRAPRADLRQGRRPFRSIYPRPKVIGHSNDSQGVSAAQVARIRKILQGLQLESIRMQASGRGLLICVDNSVFERSAIDAIGVVLGVVSQEIRPQSKVSLILTKNALPLAEISTRAGAFARMLSRGEASPHLLIVHSNPSSACPRDSEQGDRPFGRPRLSLSPVLTPTYATEFGYLDLQVAARWGLDLPLAWGSVLRIRYQHPIWNTENFDLYKPFHWLGLRPGFREAALHQALPLGYGFMALASVGLFDNDRWTAGLHLRYQAGIHSLSGFASAFTMHFNRAYPVALGQYRVEWPGGPLALRVTGGRFPDQRRGLRVAFDVAWGDTVASAYYRLGTTAQAIGAAISLPLAPRKNRIWGKGEARVLLSTQTQIKQSINTRVGTRFNQLVDPRWIDSGTAYKALGSIYTEADRLTESRITHAHRRMRDAYFRYLGHH